MVESRQQRRARERATAKAAAAGRAYVPITSEQALIDGVEPAPDTRIRLATGSDLSAMESLVELAEVELDPIVAEAIRHERMAGALRAGLRGGHDALIEDVAAAATATVDEGDPHALFLRSGLPLVAEHGGEVVGTLLAYPPARVISRYYQAAAEESARAQHQAVLIGAIALIKLKAVAVADTARGGRIGSALVATATELYRHCQFQVLYGQIPAGRDLDSFYTRAGFDVGQPGDGLDLWVIFGRHGGIHADQGERLFARWLH